jgi:hypothetical protein
LRRQALLASGHVSVDTVDLERMLGDGLAARRANADPMVLAMLQQVHQIHTALSGDEPWVALLDRFPELGSARRSLGAEPSQLVDLLGRYRDDWAKLNYPLVKEFLPATDRGGSKA